MDRLDREIPGVNCQEPTREELLETLRITLQEALELNWRNIGVESLVNPGAIDYANYHIYAKIERGEGAFSQPSRHILTTIKMFR